MSNITINCEQLKGLYHTAILNETLDAFGLMAVEWAQKAAAEINLLRAEIDRLEVLDKRRCEEIRRLYSRDRQSLHDFNNLRAENEVLRESGISAAAALSAAISLLERGGRKAAPSDKMFYQMLDDYRKALENARAVLRGEGEK